MARSSLFRFLPSGALERSKLSIWMRVLWFFGGTRVQMLRFILPLSMTGGKGLSMAGGRGSA